MFQYGGVIDPGCQRIDNEDRILMNPDLGLFAVADGMGGHRHGETAAELAVSTLKCYLQTTRSRHDVTWPFGYNFMLSLEANRLVTGILLANRHIWKRSEEAPECAGMGSTIAAILIDGDRAAVANVGDSRGYLFRAGKLEQLTVDDTWLNAVMHRDVLDQSALLSHPMRNVLTQAAGSQHDLDVHTVDVEFEAGDLVLLCSDGVYGVVCDEAIAGILRSPESAEQQATRLKDAARAGGGPDNISCIVIHYQPEPAGINP
jgi:protein phosphatase